MASRMGMYLDTQTFFHSHRTMEKGQVAKYKREHPEASWGDFFESEDLTFPEKTDRLRQWLTRRMWFPWPEDLVPIAVQEMEPDLPAAAPRCRAVEALHSMTAPSPPPPPTGRWERMSTPEAMREHADLLKAYLDKNELDEAARTFGFDLLQPAQWWLRLVEEEEAPPEDAGEAI